MAIFLLISGTGGAAASASYVVCYVGFVSSFFVLSTIGYDEYDNGNAYLFTLPFRRSTYAVEKYIFGLSMGILTMFIMLVIEGAYFRVQDISADWTILLVTFGSGAACLAGFLALMIPFQLKFGAEKWKDRLDRSFYGSIRSGLWTGKGIGCQYHESESADRNRSEAGNGRGCSCNRPDCRSCPGRICRDQHKNFKQKREILNDQSGILSVGSHIFPWSAVHKAAEQFCIVGGTGKTALYGNISDTVFSHS